jgi:hypothetical protein
MKHVPIEEKKIEFNPSLNPDAISIIRQPDGNWKGYQLKKGNLITVRQISPATVLEYLLVHDGIVK